MRITDNILFNNFLFNINKINEKVFKNNEMMSSGKRLLDLSSDPIALSKVLSLKDINMRFDQYVTNINSANAYLDAEDTALSNADNLLHKAGVLLVDGANTINNDLASRTAIAENLDAIKDELVDSANTVFQGKYLFSGTKTDTKPIQNLPNEATVVDKQLSGDIKDIKIASVENFEDINQLEDDNYQVKIQNGILHLCRGDCSNPQNYVPIDADFSNEAEAGGNKLATYIDLNDPKVKEKIENGQWLDTGRGLKIKIELNSPSSDINSINSTVSLNYKSGGRNVYMGDENTRDVEYSDKLTSPINITAKDIYKPTNQTLKNQNELIDETTGDNITKSAKLVDVDLPPEFAKAIENVAQATNTDYRLKVGDKIVITGTDHDGNLVKGTFDITSNADINTLLSFARGLDSIEVLDTNKAFKTYAQRSITSATKLSEINDPNINAAISSTLILRGFDHSGNSVAVSFALQSSTTIGSIAQAIATNFDADVRINHGKIEIEDNHSSKSDLKVYAFTKNSKVPIFGSFDEVSLGGSGGFKDVDTEVKDGRIYFKDKRPSTSRFNINFSVVDSGGNLKPDIFGVFNIDKLGRGVDTFRAIENASYALKNPNSLNQISKPSSWQDISTMQVKITGKYLGSKNDQWSVKVAKVSNTQSTHFNAISKQQIEAIANSLSNNESKNVGMFEVDDSKGNVVAVVSLDVGKDDSGKYYYTIKTKKPQDPSKQIDYSKISSIDMISGTTIYNIKNQGISTTTQLADKLFGGLNGIVIQTEDAKADADFSNTTVNGIPGVKLNFLGPKDANVPAVFQKGDSFSFKLTNAVEQALGKVKDALDQVLTSRSIIGARTNRFQLAMDRVRYIKLSNTKTISELEDANIADVFSEFKRNQIVMQATLEVGAKLTSNNLFNYIQ
ncbi:flagellar hook-associated protein FlgL [Hippea jasoniae]|uniref:flagellar hook-associated protein FlgL n=1 Tax=Hippea jasoniae TaxID=944479 RepID=UPI000554BEBF|nr:flagellar hook-associated protein FlgL [Hippea jasoniae]